MVAAADSEAEPLGDRAAKRDVVPLAELVGELGLQQRIPFIRGFLGVVVDRAGNGIAAAHGSLWTPQDFDALQIEQLRCQSVACKREHVVHTGGNGQVSASCGSYRAKGQYPRMTCPLLFALPSHEAGRHCAQVNALVKPNARFRRSRLMLRHMRASSLFFGRTMRSRSPGSSVDPLSRWAARCTGRCKARSSVRTTRRESDGSPFPNGSFTPHHTRTMIASPRPYSSPSGQQSSSASAPCTSRALAIAFARRYHHVNRPVRMEARHFCGSIRIADAQRVSPLSHALVSKRSQGRRAHQYTGQHSCRGRRTSTKP